MEIEKKEKLEVILASYLFFKAMQKKQEKQLEENVIKQIDSLYNPPHSK